MYQELIWKELMTNNYRAENIRSFLSLVEEHLGNSREIRSIFDIGSCHGLESALFSEIYENAAIETFEANPAQIPIIEKNLTDCYNVSLNSVAVNDYDGKCKFYPIDRVVSRSVWFDSNQGASSLYRTNGRESEMGEHYVQNEIEVSCTRLDTFCEKKNIKGPQIIWMDLQGAELKALKGLGERIHDVEFIWTEIEIEPLYHDQDLLKDIDPWLQDHGFYMRGKSLAKDKKSGDFIYVRKI